MASEKQIRVHNKSNKPDNIVLKEQEIVLKCEEIQDQLPKFLRGFFAYLRGNVLPMTRLAYLNDIKFFCNYLVDETDLTDAEDISDIKLKDFNNIKGANAKASYC